MRPRSAPERIAAGGGGARVRDRGAALVEAAFVFPVLILLTFGSVEFGIFFKDVSTISSAVAAGARTAVTQSRATDYYTNAQAAVTAALTASGSTPVRLVVFRADPATGRPCTTPLTNVAVTGVPPCTASLASGVDVATCTQCYVWDWSGGSWSLRGGTSAPSPSWPATSQWACGAVATNDYLGVYVEATHPMFTGMFGPTRTIKDSTMMRLEPVPSPCAP